MRAVLPLFLLLTLLMGCSNDTTASKGSSTSDADITTTEKPKTAWPTDVKIYKDDKGKVLCPIMVATIDSVEQSVGFQDYKGVRYYFCCDMCPEKFKADPEKYIPKAKTEAK